MSVAPEIIAALIGAAGSMGSSAIAKKTDSPSDASSILDWTYEGKNQQGRPSYNEGGRAYQFMSSHFKNPPPDLPEDRKIYDDSGRLLGWFADAGEAKSGFAGKNFTTKSQARTKAAMSPYQMNRGTEGEMWLGQRENIFRQDLDFSKRQASNQLSIRQSTQPGELALGRSASQFEQDTRHQNLQNEWQWQQSTAAQEGAAFRARMGAQYPGASTWDLLSGGSASGVGPGAVPGLPGMSSPSAGTQRSGPDPSVMMAKLQADSQAMQTIAQAKIAQQQMQVQENIAKRKAVIEFMNTAIAGAKSPSEIMQRAAAAKLATKQTETEGWKPGLLHEQASEASASASLKDAQRAKTVIDTENSRTGTMVNKLRNNAGDLFDYLRTVVPEAQSELYRYFRRHSVR